MIKIAVMVPKMEFALNLQQRLSGLAKVVYTEKWDEQPVTELVQLFSGAEYLLADPSIVGGFEKAESRMTELMNTLPKLKGVALGTTSYGWLDLELCRTKGIQVSNVPGYSRESVAEHALSMLLGLAKRIFESDRKYQSGKYELLKGTEIFGKTLGIIGLGSIGSRMAELGQAVGMNVIAYNRSPKKQKGVEMVSLSELIRRADAISIHVRDNEELHGMLGAKEFRAMKPGVQIVNTATRELLDETALAAALKSGKVGGYAYEAEDLVNTPLFGIDTAIGLQAFGWYTKEALANLMRIWVENTEAMVKGKPQHLVNGANR